nr:hypothetical protein [Tanacetum cinerariifolium]
MSQNFYNSNSSGFDQTQPPQFPVVHPPPQETSIEISHDQENVLLLAWDRVSEIKDAFDNKQYKPEDVQELFRKLLDDLQNIHEELAEFINSPSRNRPAVYDDDDDDVDYTIAITPVLSTEEPDNSLSMGDEHLDTIPTKESDEVIKSSVENLVPIPSEFKGTFTSIFKYHTLKQLSIKRGDEYSFVIRPYLVRVTFESVRIDLCDQIHRTQHVLIIETSQSRQHDNSEPVSYCLTD